MKKDVEIRHLDYFNYKFKLFSSKRKLYMPMVTIPFSSLLGLILFFTTIIFLNESLILTRELVSCLNLSIFSIEKADWI